MNFKQIRLLNDTAKVVNELSERLAILEGKSSQSDNVLIDEIIERISKLENPPKRKPGRPRSTNAEK